MKKTLRYAGFFYISYSLNESQKKDTPQYLADAFRGVVFCHTPWRVFQDCSYATFLIQSWWWACRPKTIEVVNILEISNKLWLGNILKRLEIGKREMVCTYPKGNILLLQCMLTEFKNCVILIIQEYITLKKWENIKGMKNTNFHFLFFFAAFF